MKNMRLTDEFGGITGFHRTVMHPYTQDKPFSTQIALVSDKLDKSTGMCIVWREFGDSENTDKLEANMVDLLIKLASLIEWVEIYGANAENIRGRIQDEIRWFGYTLRGKLYSLYLI